MAQASIDQLTPTRSLIDLSSHSSGDFGLEDYELSFVFDDIVLVDYRLSSENVDADYLMKKLFEMPEEEAAGHSKKSGISLDDLKKMASTLGL